MKKNYLDANDKNVSYIAVYGDTSDNKLYNKATGADKAQVALSEVKDLYEKGLLKVVAGEDMVDPIGLVNSKIITVAVGSSVDITTQWSAKAE